VSEGVGIYQGSHATRHDILDKIAVEVVNDSSLSEFLRKFADAWLTADAENKEILRPAWPSSTSSASSLHGGRDRKPVSLHICNLHMRCME
jgi:hypothetical protein